MLNGHNPDRARDALQSLNPNCDRAAWVKTGMAFHAAGGDFDTFNDWSAGADNYNAQACRATYRSFKTAPGGVGAGALFGMARDAGWQDGPQSPSEAPSKPARTAATPRKLDASTMQAPCKPGMSADEAWSRCLPATSQHPYIASKGAAGVPLDALRVVPAGDPLRIMGENMAGALVVPCMAADGRLSTLQLIPPPDVAQRLKADGKPGKLNLPGCKVEGWFTVGTLATGGTAYVVEGIGQAWACWQATGAAAVVCFGAGNVAKVATALRQMDDTARLVLVPDAERHYLIEWSDLLRQLVAEVKAIKRNRPSIYLFATTDEGTPYTDAGFSCLWNRLMKSYAGDKTQPKWFTAHDLRALYVTQMLGQSRDPKTHKNAQTMMNVYERSQLIKVSPLA